MIFLSEVSSLGAEGIISVAVHCSYFFLKNVTALIWVLVTGFKLNRVKMFLTTPVTLITDSRARA